jgi:hypothetical protein
VVSLSKKGQNQLMGYVSSSRFIILLWIFVWYIIYFLTNWHVACPSANNCAILSPTTTEITEVIDTLSGQPKYARLVTNYTKFRETITDSPIGTFTKVNRMWAEKKHMPNILPQSEVIGQKLGCLGNQNFNIVKDDKKVELKVGIDAVFVKLHDGVKWNLSFHNEDYTLKTGTFLLC